MENSSEIVSFVLTAYGNVGKLKYLYFVIILFWYSGICVANTVLIVVINVDKRLHEPMYILLSNLCVNQINVSTSLYPLLLSQMFSDSHEVTLPWCFLHMSCMYISGPAEFCSLAAMAYDRYISICHPLRYNVIMKTERVFVMILLVWIYSFLSVILSFSFIFSLKFCGTIIENVYCNHRLIIRLSCLVSVHSFISDIFFLIVSIFIPFTLISVSYVKILAVCRKTSTENKQKAVTTCVPQIVSVSNLFVGSIFQCIDSSFIVAHVSVRIILSIYLFICQPMLTPFLYGFNLPKIRQSCKNLLLKKKSIALFTKRQF